MPSENEREKMPSEKEREKKSYVLEPEPGHLHLTAGTVATITGTANATITTIAADLSKRIHEKADLVTTTDTEDEKKAD